MKTQIKVHKIDQQRLDITTPEDENPNYLYGDKIVSLEVVFPDEAFYMMIDFPLDATTPATEKNIMSIMKKRLTDMNNVIYHGL